MVGQWGFGNKSLCGADNRVASNEDRVARIDPIGCTGWLIDNGKLLTAGHCLDGGSSNQTLSFNVPLSNSNTSVNFPPASEQYSINQNSFVYANGGVGNDWGVFEVYDTNGNQPHAVYGAFAFKQDYNPSTIRITGFGVDDGTANQTNQTHSGSNTGSSSNTMRYTVDTTGAGSWKYYTQNITCSATMTVEISGGSGDADLYTRKTSNPTTSSYACRPYLNGNNETCTFAATSGDYKIGIRAYSTYSGVLLEVSY